MSRGLRGRIAVVFGTRPEIIKLAPVLRELGDAGRPIFTGQHYDDELARIVLLSCGLPALTPDLPRAGGTIRGTQIGVMISRLTETFRGDRPDAVVVQGDTNTASAAAQSAHYLGIPVIHVEAGLRSGDRTMPEEINRCLIAVLADMHCAATPGNLDNLVRMGVPIETIHVTGNPVIEAIGNTLPSQQTRAAILAEFGLARRNYIVATVHRPGNTDDPARLNAIIEQLSSLDTTVVFPVHPRTAHRMQAARTPLTATGIHFLPALDYATFLALTAESALVVSDSGSIQEEVTILRRPLVVVRPNTERPETIAAGFAILCEPADIGRSVTLMAARAMPEIPSPFGDGHAAKRIARLAVNFHGSPVL